MSEAAKGGAGESPNLLYCARLVELAFPASPAPPLDKVKIGDREYSRGELLAELGKNPELKKSLEQRYRHNWDGWSIDQLIATAFPRTVEIDGKQYEQQELREELEKNEELKKRLGREYRRGAGLPGVERIMQALFPVVREIGGNRLNEEQLRAELTANMESRRKLALHYLREGQPWNASELVETAFQPKLAVGTEEYTRQALATELPRNPKLQKRVATRMHYVPSKWLLEQEMQARLDWQPDPGKDIYTAVDEKGLFGVCFSGGGIRSATFNLGVLQGLAQVGLLPLVDYLSSVSGGGYIHQFLAAWITRNPKGRQGVIEELIPQAEPSCLPRSPEPIRWLMRYASYLTPARGMFSTDTWTMVAIWFRNTILNQIPILAGLAFACFAMHLLVAAPAGYRNEFWKWPGAWTFWLGLAVIGGIEAYWAVLSLMKLGGNLLLQRRMRRIRAGAANMTAEPLLTNKDVQLEIIAPWLGFSMWLSYWVQLRLNAYGWLGLAGFLVFCVWVGAIVMVVIFAGGAMDEYGRLHVRPSAKDVYLARLGMIGGGVLATAVACALGWAYVLASAQVAGYLSHVIGPLGAMKEAAQQTLNFTVKGTAANFTANLTGALSGASGPPGGYLIDPWRLQLAVLPGLLLSVPYVAIELTLGLLGRDYSDMRREWLARLRAWSLLYALLWFALASVALLGPYVVYWLKGIGPAAVGSAVVTFLAAHGATIFAGWSGKSDGKPTDKGFLGLKPMDLLALAAAPITILGLLIAVSFAASCALDKTYAVMGHDGWYLTLNVGWCVVALGIALLFGRRVDINEFSMQSFYKNRLSRCYLAATVAERQADPFSGFDGRAELTLANGMIQRSPLRVRDLLPQTSRSVKNEPGTYQGPFPIFCTTLNLTTGDDLATQERKGVSFAFTPLYSGYSVGWTDGDRESGVSYNGFVPTEEYAYPDEGISLDTAVAISGAAVNPNMGYNSNPALAFLMTFFNVRLGWWISNPRKMDTWPAGQSRATPKYAVWYLFRELFGAVNDAAPYVNLSDGGHFENMGLYELVRRRCKYILVCDAEEDAEMKFGGMGAAITKCRADFGAEIDLDLRPLQTDDKTGMSKAHCVVGTIQYPPPPEVVIEPDKRTVCKCLGDDDDDLYMGYIVYMKTSLVGDEPPDLMTYKLKHDVFPQDSTADQWFQETQFEAYRRLGHHIAMAAMRPALSPLETAVDGPDDIPEFFRRMNAIWYPRTPEMEQYLGNHLKQYETILKDLRERAELAGLETALFDPGKDALVPWAEKNVHAGNLAFAMQYANALLKFMYTVYTNLQLAFPDNRTSPHAVWWICLFRRWCRVDLVQESWTAHVRTYPEEFLLFARRELMLP